jgi:iron only hydrogenase large subunit-like protein/nitrogen-specific signal transduction histidine kinase
MNNGIGIVSTISDRCKRCYSCIRECPAKAIKVINGQAAVLQERCITCGHCVKVCSQNAKQIINDVEYVLSDILIHYKSAALIAPSFAASFPDTYLKFPTALRKLGFAYVIETAFGADLISEYYRDEFDSKEKKTIISSACPAVVNYIEKYYGSLVPNIAKIVSPMIATGKFVRENLGKDIKQVFIGPCIAKKSEYKDEEISGIINAVLTFSDIKYIFKKNNIHLDELEDGEFDPPLSYLGKSYPLAGGLLKTADISGDILEKEIIVVEGKTKVMEIIDEIADNRINAKFVDILFCEGCISGPAISSDLNYYSKRETLINYIEERAHLTDKKIWKSNLFNSRKIDFSRKFSFKNQRRPMPSEEIIKEKLALTNKKSIEDELNCGACGYSSCREFAVAIAKDLAEEEMCLPFLIDKLAKANDDLNNTQEQLRIAEKLASIGQLAAGVAHEINNPLGTILLYASILKRELAGRLENNQNAEDIEMIIEEAERCKNIVTNLLNFARQGKLNLSRINISALLSGIINKIKINSLFERVEINLIIDCGDDMLYGDEDQLLQVFINLINNAVESMNENNKKILGIKVFAEDNFIITEISDTGCGIAKENFGKVFTPFFTTKKIGKGTGLGLAISYGIIKMHRGFISFQSELGKGTCFRIKLPKNLIEQDLNLN